MNEFTVYKKGDLAVGKAIARLIELNYEILTPFSLHLRYDLVICKNNIFKKIQVKYSADREVASRTGQRLADGWNPNYYEEGDFDYYAVYLPEIDRVLFPSIKYAGITFAIEPQPVPFWWFEDFLDLTDDATKRIYEEFEETERINNLNQRSKAPRFARRMVDRPTKEALEKMVWEKPTTQIAKMYGVSDKAVEKWCKIYEIKKPGRGHWS